MEVWPGQFKTLGARITAGTNNPTGYDFTFSDSDGDNNLSPKSGISGAAIAPVAAGGVTIADAEDSGKDFTEDTWGYAFQTAGMDAPAPATPLTYLPVPTSSTPVYTTEGPGDNYHYFTIATRIGQTLPAAVYND